MSCPPGALRSKVARHKNWIDEQGGLPRYIEKIACHVHFDKGKDIGVAIAVAISDCKRMCSTGESNFGQVNPGSRAEACDAIAQWEKMKADAHANK